jgi:peptidyl-prolyl cis-trans isomerase D
MLETFRNASKTWVVKGLFALLTLSFVAWGVGDFIRGGPNKGPAIEVGHTAISANEVLNEFKREVEHMQPAFGGKLTSEDARKLGLLDRTIDSMVTRTLVDEAARGLGLAASDDAILKSVGTNPSFRSPTGQFDRDLFRRALGRAGFTEDSFMRSERSNIVRNQLWMALKGGVAAPAALVDPLLRFREERRVAETVLIKDEALPLLPAPDAAALEAFYKDNTSRFMAPEFRALTVLLLRPADVAASVQISDEMIADAYQTRQEEFNSPERRTLSQIVLTESSAISKASDMVGHGKDLAAIAKALNAQIIDLGTLEKRDLPEGLAEAVFRLPTNATSQPIKTDLGWHVVKVNTVQNGRTRSLAEVRGQIEADLRKEKAMDGLSELANKVEDALGGGATLEEAGTNFSLKVIKYPALDAHGRAPNGKAVADLPKSDQFLDVAFHTDQSTESPLTEVENNGYFLVRVDGITAPHAKPLTEVRTEVASAWQAEKRHLAARDRAEKVAERLKAGEPAAAVAQSFGLKADTTPPFARETPEGSNPVLPPTVAAEMFSASLGGVTIGNVHGGSLVARVAKIVPFDPGQNRPAAEAAGRRVGQTVSADIVEQYLSAVNAAVGVKVDRAQLSHEE